MLVKTICVVTGSRAEYDLLYPLLCGLKTDINFKLQLVVTGMHLSPEFGLTVQQIENDGFSITEKVQMLLSGDDCSSTSKSLGLGVLGFSDVFSRLKPDIIVLLGDRFEILAAAQVALIHQIPIAHIHGGELTLGAFDDAIRHSISKMSQLHFVAAEDYRKRLIQMGENPNSVYNVGALGLENLSSLIKISRKELEDFLDMTFSNLKPLFLITYHPETLTSQDSLVAINQLLSALDEFPNSSIVFTFPNTDNGNRNIILSIKEFVERNKHRARFVTSLGQKRYLSLMSIADVVIGNSSSGIIEAPALGVPTVNIGLRQKGRLMAKSIINCSAERDDIVSAISEALSSTFKDILKSSVSLYGDGQVSKKMIEILKDEAYSVQKKFFDIKHEY